MKKSNPQLFLKFAKFLLPHWKLEVLVGSVSLLGVALSLTYPYLTKIVIDQAFRDRDLRLFLILTVIGTLILVVSGLTSKLTNYLNQYIRARVDFDITRTVFEKMQSLPLSFFSHRSSGEHLFKIQYDIYRAADSAVTLLPQALSLIPRFLLVFVIVFRLDAKLSALALLLAPLTLVVPYLFTRRLQRRLKAYIESCQRIFVRLNEVFSRVYLVKAFSKEKREVRSYVRLMKENLSLKKRNIGLEVSSQFYGALAQRAVLGVVAFYGGWRVIEGDLTLGSLTAIMVYLTQLVNMQGSFAKFFQDTALNLVSCERLEPVLDVAVAGDGRRLLEPDIKTGEIRFRDVHFCYDGGKPVLEGTSLTVRSGSWVAIVGPSGVGKTTIINLLLRLYDPKAGSITIDGHDIKEIEPAVLKSRIGFAPQEPLLWNDTVMNNLRYGKEDAADDEIYWAARLAQAHGFIDALPEKYQTVIGENACKISEGQKQRISIARALVKKPRVLIFDEALASIDGEGETAILSNIARELKDVTLIIVTHRLSTLDRVEAVYHLESLGRIRVTNHEKHPSGDAFCREPFSSSLVT